MSDMYLGSQAPMYQNVHIRVFNQKTGKVRIERTAKNRVTKLMLWGIAQFLSGSFNDSTPDKIYEFTPRFLALGSNLPGADAQTAGVATTVTVRDSRLLNEYKYSTSSGRSINRIPIQSRQHSKLSTSFNDPFVKLIFSTYINSSIYNGLEIGEAGLFSKELDNNCLARVAFPPFKKEEGEVIDIQWEITLLSYGTTKYAENVKIEGHGRVIIPLTYTPYHIITKNIGLYNVDGDLCASGIDSPIFRVDDSGNIEQVVSITNAQGTEWETYLKSVGLTLEFVYENLNPVKYKLDEFQFKDKNNELPGLFYLGDKTRIAPTPNYLADSDNQLLQDSNTNLLLSADPQGTYSLAQPVYMSSIYEESIEYETIPLGFHLVPSSDIDDFTIKDSAGKETDYKVVDNEIFCYNYETEEYDSMNCYLYRGAIINSDNAPTGYVYDSNYAISEVKEKSSANKDTGAFLAYKSQQDKEYIFGIYRITGLNITIDTGYWIDWTKDKEVYSESADTLYHITNDNYFAIGETLKLSAYITPPDATDKSVVWSIINDNISKLNQDGVLTAWNVGQTIAVVSTTNNMRARVEVEVVKNSQLIPVDELYIEPSNITLMVTETGKIVNISAIVKPIFSTYKTVNWTFDDALTALCTIDILENNNAQVKVNGSGNVGRGILTASTQDGKQAKCIITVIFESDAKDDCPDIRYHEDQKS